MWLAGSQGKNELGEKSVLPGRKKESLLDAEKSWITRQMRKKSIYYG